VETELQTYKRTLQLIFDDLLLMSKATTTTDELRLRLLEAELLEIQILVEGALDRWDVKEIKPDAK